MSKTFLAVLFCLISLKSFSQVPEQLEGKWRGMIEVNDGTKKLYGEIRLVIGGFLNTSTPNNIDFEIKNFAVERNSYFKYVKDVYYGSDNNGNRTVVFSQIALLDASRAKITGKYIFRHNVGSNGTVSLIGNFIPDDAANKHLSINAWLVKKDKYENYTEEEMKIALALIAPDKPSQQSQGAKTNSKSSTSDDNYEFNKNKSFIAKAFQDYKQYASAGKGADAILFIDKQSISHFQQVADWVRTADSSTVAKLPFMDALLVLMTRTVATKEQIASFNGEQLLIFAINNSFIGKDNGSTGSMAENTLEINATEATVASMINGQVTGVDYVFHKEDWQWKFNVEAVIEISNRVLSQLAANSGRTYDPKFKTELTTLMTNKTVPKNVWRPVTGNSKSLTNANEPQPTLSSGAKLMFSKLRKFNSETPVKNTLSSRQMNQIFELSKWKVATNKKGFIVEDYCEDITEPSTEIADFNADGKPEVILNYYGTCLAGNTAQGFMMYVQDGKGNYYNVIDEIGSINPCRTKTKGYPDLIIGGPGFTRPEFKWDGKKYIYSGDVDFK